MVCCELFNYSRGTNGYIKNIAWKVSKGNTDNIYLKTYSLWKKYFFPTTHVFKKGTILKIWNVLFDLNICLRDNINIIHTTNKIPFGHV